MFLAATTDIHAHIFKLVDRLHFIKLLKEVPPPQQEEIHSAQHAKLTLAIYAPLADRLGLWRIKPELEDMSFRLLQPDRYKEIARQLEVKKDERKKYVNDIIPIIREQIEPFGIQVEISVRAKHIYSVYQKMEAKQLCIDEINDLLGIRIIVETKEDCYNVQGILHEYWLPITTDYGGKAGRDWIAHGMRNEMRASE
jgi:GTP pyrophosphokinase